MILDKKMLNTNNGLYIGADGCRGGWIACILDHGEFRMEKFDSIEALVSVCPKFDAFLIDMVIGLRSNSDQIRPDKLARKELRNRASVVFPAPCRQAVYAETEEEQKRANIRIFGKSLSKQTINIIPKIRELDEYLYRHTEYRNRILESHPELVFSRLNDSVVMSRKKESIGFTQRANILKKYLPENHLSDLRQSAKEFKCNPDDLLDAVCLAVTAALSAGGMCNTIPDNPQQDENGLYMKMTVPKGNLRIIPAGGNKEAVVTAELME